MFPSGKQDAGKNSNTYFICLYFCACSISGAVKTPEQAQICICPRKNFWQRLNMMGYRRKK